MSVRALSVTVLALLLAMLVALGHVLAPGPRAGVAEQIAVAPCDPARGPCTAALPGGGQVELTIGPHPIKALAPLSLGVKITGSEAARVDVDFSGADMPMGGERTQLARGAGDFVGQAILPVCVSASMDWLATVLIVRDGREFSIPFRFTVVGR